MVFFPCEVFIALMIGYFEQNQLIFTFYKLKKCPVYTFNSLFHLELTELTRIHRKNLK